MTIKLIIFDLDGVLIDSRNIHYIALNSALEEIDSKYTISYEEHLAKYDGHPTSYKLKLLTKDKNLPSILYNQIWQRKQDLTQETILNTFKIDYRICTILQQFKKNGFLIYCASNSIWQTIKNALYKKGFIEYIDYFVSNQEIKNPKPSPEIYYKCFQHANLSPYEVLICEDSPVGLTSAKNSGANICKIENTEDVTFKKIMSYIDKYNKMHKYTIDKIPTEINNINIVIPAAGLGSRFTNAGYTFPKLLIDVHGKPMIQTVVENINIKGRFIFIVQKNHYEKYNLNYLLNAIAPNCLIIQTEGLTEGAACSLLLAKEYINNDESLILANSDQFLEWDANEFLYVSNSDHVDACISIFENSHPKFSYAQCNENGYVTEVAEKKVISNNATTGIYYWKKGSDCIKYTEQMISKNIRINNEFYNCPVFNEAISDGKKIKTVSAKKFWCLGTPEDLQYYLNNYI